MDSKDARIVYFGTPDFAVPALKGLVSSGYKVVAVVTTPDKPSGRGQKVNFSPVKAYAVEAGLPVLQPEKLKDPLFLEELASYKADIQIVIAFRMLPELVWNMPRMGTLNVHASLLPAYRGAAPIHWAIINGESQTGLTTFRLKHAIDTGDLLLQESEEILPEDTTGSLYSRLMEKSSGILQRTLDGLYSSSISPIPQPSEDPFHRKAPKIFPEDAIIPFEKESKQVIDWSRGMTPSPGARFYWKGKQFKVGALKISDRNLEPYTFQCEDNKHWYVGTANGAVELLEIQMEGKKSMATEMFLRGQHDFPTMGILDRKKST